MDTLRAGSGWTDDEADIRALAQWISEHIAANVDRVEVLPFHQMAKQKLVKRSGGTAAMN